MIVDLNRINYIKERNRDTVMELLWSHVHEKDKNDPEALKYLKSKNYYEWYFAISRYMCPQTILELGVRFGYSGMTMLSGHGVANYVGLDNECGEPGSNAYAEPHLKHFTQGIVELLFVDTQTCDKLPWEGKAQLIHVDANHLPQGLYHDLDLVLPAWDSKGLIIVDDVIADRALYGAAMVWLQHNAGLTHRMIDTYQGLMLIYKEA